MVLCSPFSVLSAKNPEADYKGPTFVTEPINKIDFSNSTGAEIECRASGNPPPEIIWVRSDGTAVGNVPGLRQVMANGNLVFPPFRAEDYRQDVHAQAYACLAKNPVGSIISRDVNVRAGKLSCGWSARHPFFSLQVPATGNQHSPAEIGLKLSLDSRPGSFSNRLFIRHSGYPILRGRCQ